MLRRNLALTLTTILLSTSVVADDFGIYMPNDPTLEDSLKNSKPQSGHSGYLSGEYVEDVLGKEPPLKEEKIEEKVLSEKELRRRDLQDLGQTIGGTPSLNTSYDRIDKKAFSKKLMSSSVGAVNISYVQNDYTYSSTGSVIDQTTETGRHANKGGTLFLRHDSYLTNQSFLNTFWSGGIGVGLSTGKGIFVDGSRSNTTLNLWQIPIEFGIGFEIPVFSLVKLYVNGGGGAMTLYQNRNDFQRGEKNKRRIQVSPGVYGIGQFRMSLTSFSKELAYDVFTSSNITNILLNVEYRYQSYESFKENNLAISGSSIGVGFTFEYL